MATIFPRHSHTAMSESEMAETLIDPYEETPKYAHGTAGWLGIVMLIAVVFRLIQHLRENSRFSNALGNSRVYKRVTAFGRYLSSRQFKVLGWHLPTSGMLFLMVTFFIFQFTWTWGVRPYYRSRWNVGSPPLAMRSGMMALACFPFIIAFGAKWNIVSFITGVSYEKLQVYHQWMSHLFLFLSLVHTFPFVILGMREIKPSDETFDNVDGLTQLEWSWHIAHKVYYWSGTALLVILAWLCWASLPIFRRKYYELFKWLHVISAILFTAFFFVHCNKLLGSWDYLWATTAIFAGSTLARFAWMLYLNASGIPQATYEVLPSRMIKLTIRCNPQEMWLPGQHYYLNFVQVQPFQSHPFTIANCANPRSTAHQEMVVFIRQQAGMTQRLMKFCGGSQPERGTSVLIDGPYGRPANLGMYDQVLLVAGGAGISFCLPILQDLVRRMDEAPAMPCKIVHLIWSVRDEDAIKWLDSTLDKLMSKAAQNTLRITIHVSGATSDVSSPALSMSQAKTMKEKPDDDIESVKSGQSTAQKQILFERAVLPHAIHQLALGLDSQSLGVAVCGPGGMVYDVRNTVADLQKNVALGKAGPREVFLQTEEFTW